LYSSTLEYSEDAVKLLPMDARQMDEKWTDRFDVILEKGALDVIYLSGDGNSDISLSAFSKLEESH
jgi:hypothetical protein